MRYEKLIVDNLPDYEFADIEDLFKSTGIKSRYAFDKAVNNLIKEGFIVNDISEHIYLIKSREYFAEYYSQQVKAKVIKTITFIATIVAAIASVISVIVGFI